MKPATSARHLVSESPQGRDASLLGPWCPRRSEGLQHQRTARLQRQCTHIFSDPKAIPDEPATTHHDSARPEDGLSRRRRDARPPHSPSAIGRQPPGLLVREKGDAEDG